MGRDWRHRNSPQACVGSLSQAWERRYKHPPSLLKHNDLSVYRHTYFEMYIKQEVCLPHQDLMANQSISGHFASLVASLPSFLSTLVFRPCDWKCLYPAYCLNWDAVLSDSAMLCSSLVDCWQYYRPLSQGYQRLEPTDSDPETWESDS